MENRRVPLQRFSFRSCETKNFDKTVMPPPLLCMKIFDKRIFLKHQNFLQWNILVQSDKNFSTGNRDTPPPLLSIKYFSLQKFSKHRMVPWRSFFGPLEIKIFLTKPWIFPFLCLKNFDTRILSKHRRFLLRILSALWDKNFSTDFNDIPFLCIKFWDTRNFLKHRSVPQRNFSVLCDKVFDGETWYPPPLSCIKFFDTRIFLIHRSVAQRNVSVLWDKKFWTKSRGTPSFA